MRYVILTKRNELDSVLSGIEQAGEVVVDLETTSLATHSKDIKIVGIGLCYDNNTAFYIPQNHKDQEISLEDVKPVLEDSNVAKIGHNIKYDARVFNRFGVNLKNIIFDTFVASYCLHGDRIRHNLDDLTLDHFNHVKIRTKDVIPRKSKKLPNPTMLDSPIEKVAVYCCEDVWYTFKLYKELKRILRLPYNQAAFKLFYDIELPLLPVLIDMECTGVAIDPEKIVELNNKFEDLARQEKDLVDKALGRELIISNPNDISKAIYEELKIQDKLGVVIKMTPTGKFSTSKDTLNSLKKDGFVNSILNIKKLMKLTKTYMSSFPEYISGHTGLIHTFFNQCRTSTGRLSSSEPNLQNQPSRDELGREIRSLYVSRWKGIGGKILAADYSQAELRILAHIADEQVLADIFNRDGDAHLGVASKIYNKAEDQVSKSERTFTKTINFGLIYGMGPKKLGVELSIPEPDARVLMDRYLGTMKGVKKFITDSEKFLKEHGFTETFFGRRRYISKVYSGDKLDKWAAAREGMNHRVQGTNADMIKIAMSKIYQEFNRLGLKSKIVLQVHDELVIDTHPDELEIVKKTVVELMENVVKFVVPLKVGAEYGDSWLDAH